MGIFISILLTKKIFQWLIFFYVSVTGSRVTRSGMTDAAHPGGEGSLIKFPYYVGRINLKDLFGPKVPDWLKIFSSYDPDGFAK